jgi:hypothetical protein
MPPILKVFNILLDLKEQTENLKREEIGLESTQVELTQFKQGLILLSEEKIRLEKLLQTQKQDLNLFKKEIFDCSQETKKNKDQIQELEKLLETEQKSTKIHSELFKSSQQELKQAEMERQDKEEKLKNLKVMNLQLETKNNVQAFINQKADVGEHNVVGKALGTTQSNPAEPDLKLVSSPQLQTSQPTKQDRDLERKKKSESDALELDMMLSKVKPKSQATSIKSEHMLSPKDKPLQFPPVDLPPRNSSKNSNAVAPGNGFEFDAAFDNPVKEEKIKNGFEFDASFDNPVKSNPKSSFGDFTDFVGSSKAAADSFGTDPFGKSNDVFKDIDNAFGGPIDHGNSPFSFEANDSLPKYESNVSTEVKQILDLGFTKGYYY